MRLIGDVLDKPIIDRNGRNVGRADGIELELNEGSAPRVATVLVGPTTLGERVSPRAGRWVAALERRFRIDPASVRLPVEAINFTNDERLQVQASVGETGADAVERSLRRWVVRIPGGG